MYVGTHRENAIGPEGGKALAVPLEQLTALQQLNLRCFKEGEGELHKAESWEETMVPPAAPRHQSLRAPSGTSVGFPDALQQRDCC
jgi:hypothetical protein